MTPAVEYVTINVTFVSLALIRRQKVEWKGREPHGRRHWCAIMASSRAVGPPVGGSDRDLERLTITSLAVMGHPNPSRDA